MYEAYPASDSRPRAAIEGIRLFAGGGHRTARLRTLASKEIAAAREVGDPAAAAATRAAGFAASNACTHPLVDVQQTRHIVGIAGYAALALELKRAGDLAIPGGEIGDAEVRWAIEHAPVEVRDVLRQVPTRQLGKSRVDMLLYTLDQGIHEARHPQSYLGA